MKHVILTILPAAFAIAACTASQDFGERPRDLSGSLVSEKPAPTPPTDPEDESVRAAGDQDANARTPEGDPVSPDAPTYFTPSLGFIVRDAYSYDRFSPTGNRQTRGIMFTSFVSACDKAKANAGEGVLDLRFSPDVDAIPAIGTYPISDHYEPNFTMAIARVWTVSAPGCSGMDLDGGHFVSGQVVITRSDATSMEGTFEGALVGAGPSAVTVTGHFVAPRCPALGGACNP